MERFLVRLLFIIAAIAPPARAESDPKSPTGTTSPAATATASSKENSKEDDNKLSFADKIKVIRSVSGEYDVFFMAHPGPYSVPVSLPNWKNKSETPEDVLRAAFKLGATIEVTVDTDSETLVSIDSDFSRQPAASKESDINLPPEMDYLKDIIKGSKPPKE
jgi:hypothetical protein